MHHITSLSITLLFAWLVVFLLFFTLKNVSAFFASFFYIIILISPSLGRHKRMKRVFPIIFFCLFLFFYLLETRESSAEQRAFFMPHTAYWVELTLCSCWLVKNRVKVSCWILKIVRREKLGNFLMEWGKFRGFCENFRAISGVDLRIEVSCSFFLLIHIQLFH